MTENNIPTSKEIRPRKIKIETRFGKARCLRSRKDRPCDACRHRKSACIITVRPPCRFCESRGQDCTFASSPTQRTRKSTGSSKLKGLSRRELSPSNVFGDLRRPICSRVESQPHHEPSQFGARETRLQAPLSVPIEGSSDSRLSTYVDDADLSRIPIQQEQRIHTSNDIIHSQISSGNTLDGTKGLTAHFLGPSSDQDANLLSSFRSNILNETKYVDVNIRQVFPENTAANLSPVHFNIVHDLFPERDNRMKEITSERIEAYVAPHADTLVRLYFSFVHSEFPVLSKTHFLSEYCQNRVRIPASLRGVIYGLACPFWDRDERLKFLQAVDQGELFEYAHAALNRELDSPKLSTLQSCLLILHENPPLTGTTESPRNWTLACQATSCAQCLGLHTDPSLWNIPDWEKRLRKRLWWATFVTDKWASLGHGSPSHISQESFNTGDLTLEDILCGEDATPSPHGYVLSKRDRRPNQASAINFLETVRLAKHLSVLLDYS
ncbi:hypothetical protein PHISCL_01442 [Aspergillus sclerotialis]|uniref:Zn(2)-C6 fungal-type domain-containing protein n=1 Tax=Aspergillus sclerotialis TaxID=2070753 RepID=A0A3A3A3C5_9EURO|nr:hypothetical protein PHISCL_01442 [Aspergillus sclerotialis]